jgi:hypothetical protein
MDLGGKNLILENLGSGLTIGGGLIVGEQNLYGKTGFTKYTDPTGQIYVYNRDDPSKYDPEDPAAVQPPVNINIHFLAWFFGTNTPNNVKVYLPKNPIQGQKITIRNDATYAITAYTDDTENSTSRIIYASTASGTAAEPSINIDGRHVIMLECVTSTLTPSESVEWLLLGKV